MTPSFPPLIREDRHAPPNKKHKQQDKEEDEEDLNDANYDEVMINHYNTTN